jgi:hypothetical protein
MMMRLLQAGGIEVVADDRRPSDDNNPMGYFEDERVKELPAGHHEWLESAAGKAAKVVSPLLEHLPTHRSFKLIFMLRSVEEIVASQRRMLWRSGGEPGTGSDDELAGVYLNHLRRIEFWLAAQPHLDTMYVRYRDVIEAPEVNAIRIDRFLGRRLNHRAMVGTVDPNLYRERDGTS